MAAQNSLSVLAPAKINLALHVVGRRPDGYHSIETLAVFPDFGDRLSITADTRDSFSAFGPYAGELPHGADNLAVRARDALRLAHPDRSTPPVAMRLEKQLPVASGLGGGSSDAAAALKALARHWHLQPAPGGLERIGLALGADLPMCLAARPLIASGIGEVILPLPAFPELSLLLVNPGVAIATPDVFRALERRDNAALPPLPRRTDRQALFEWLKRARNDLQPAAIALAPQIREALDALGGTGAALARMSGSGATCFGVFTDWEHAFRAAGEISRWQPAWFVKVVKTRGDRP